MGEQLKEDTMNLSENKPISLCAKWVPSESKKVDRFNHFNTKLAHHMGLSHRSMRKMLTNLRTHLNLVETKLAEKKVSEIDYSKVPSIAMLRHSKPEKAFSRLDEIRFKEYKESLSAGKTKVNTGALYPHQVVEQYLNGDFIEKDELLEGQWKGLLEKLTESEKSYLSKALCIVDTSGSMYSGVSKTCKPISVAISIGLMISELCPNPVFKNSILTFSGNPEFYKIQGESLYSRVKSLKTAEWGFNTDFVKIYQLILNKAKQFNLTQEQLPTTLIVVSDMQFDEAGKNTNTNFELMKEEFNKAGYILPKIVFWNVNGNNNDFPVSATESNTAMISGFSIDILRDVLSGQEITPFTVMMRTLNRKDYDVITLA